MRRRRIFRALLLLAGLLAACRAPEIQSRRGVAFPRVLAHAPRERLFDVRDYQIQVELQPEKSSIRALCTIHLEPLEREIENVTLDLMGLVVEGVTDEHGRALDFRQRPGALEIELHEPLAPGVETALSVSYGGRPERGLWFAGRPGEGLAPTLVFSHGQTQDNRGWFPCFDEPGERATSELLLSMPASWRGSASGECVEVQQSGERRTERWRLGFPHPSYLIAFVAGELVQVDGMAGEVPLTFLAEERFAKWIPETFAETDEILDFLTDYTGHPYPFPKYSQAAVDNFPWGGMENISATTLTPLLLSDEWGLRDQPSFPLIAHEAAHQWFGDLFTCADWSHLWLNEGFATYMTLLYIEHSRGVDEFRAQMRETQEAYLAEDVGVDRRPTVWNVWKEPDDVFDTRPYQGGAARLNLLRFVLGDEIFREGVRTYCAANVGLSVVTQDLQRAMELASGRDLETFFSQWLYRSGFPEFHLDWEWDSEAGEVLLEVSQFQEAENRTPAVFELPVEVEIRGAADARLHRIELNERQERFRLPCREAPLYVAFDPHGWIPKRVNEDKGANEWLALATLAGDVNLRREAVLVLGRMARLQHDRERDATPLVAALADVLEEDASVWARADAATALGHAGGAEAEEALRRAALGAGDPKVRTAALYGLRGFGPNAGLASLAEDVFSSDSTYRVRAAAAALFCQTAPERALDFLEVALATPSPHDVLAGLLLTHLAELPDVRVPGELRKRAADRELAPTARAVAVRQLANTTRERLITSRFLVPFLEEESFHLRAAAIQTLVDLGDEGACRALQSYYPRARTSSERRVIEERLLRQAY